MQGVAQSETERIGGMASGLMAALCAGDESDYLNTGQQMDYITIIVKDESSELFVTFPSFGEYTTKRMK